MLADWPGDGQTTTDAFKTWSTLATAAPCWGISATRDHTIFLISDRAIEVLWLDGRRENYPLPRGWVIKSWSASGDDSLSLHVQGNARAALMEFHGRKFRIVVRHGNPHATITSVAPECALVVSPAEAKIIDHWTSHSLPFHPASPRLWKLGPGFVVFNLCTIWDYSNGRWKPAHQFEAEVLGVARQDGIWLCHLKNNSVVLWPKGPVYHDVKHLSVGPGLTEFLTINQRHEVYRHSVSPTHNAKFVARFSRSNASFQNLRSHVVALGEHQLQLLHVPSGRMLHVGRPVGMLHLTEILDNTSRLVCMLGNGDVLLLD